MKTYDITGLDKEEVLKELWRGSEPAIVFMSSGVEPPEYNKDEATKALQKRFVDYLCGRAIKASFEGNIIIDSKYDRYNGDGAMQAAIDRVRKRTEKTAEEPIESGNGCKFQ